MQRLEGMRNVVCVAGAKVPIVKIWDPQLELACDMNVNNTLALENTRMIKTYVQIDGRVRALAMIVKHWTRRRILNDAGKLSFNNYFVSYHYSCPRLIKIPTALGGTLSSYTWICMIINFLQTRQPPILPALHQIPHQRSKQTYGTESTFADDLNILHDYGKDNKETLAQLLFHFFRYYGFEINYDEVVVSVRHGKLLSRKEKGWDASSLTKEGRDRLCVEEPINTVRNLGNSADPTAFRGIHLEIRRAFELVSGGKLDEVCEQYVFPSEEKSTFKKPPTQPRPALLTRSNSQTSKSVKGPSNHRGGRSNFRNNGGNPRRASSGSTRPLFVNSPPAGLTATDQLSQGNLHDQLLQRYHLLQLQQETLKAQAQLMAQAQAQARLQKQSQSSQPPLRGSNSVSEGSQPNNRKSPQLPATERHALPFPLYPSYIYHYPSAAEITAGQNPAAHDGANTNPSSPSLSNAMPTNRRGLHRNASVNGLSGNNIRSRSQPAGRGPASNPGRVVLPPGYDVSNLYKVTGAVSQQTGYDIPIVNSTFAVPGTLVDNSAPKEYLGYYVHDTSQAPPYASDFAMHVTPRDIAQRRRRMTPELQQPKLSAPFRYASRSPSPLGHHRSYSTGLRTAPLPASELQRQRTEDIKTSSDDHRPVIANGSTPALLNTSDHRPPVHESPIVPGTYPYPVDTDDRGFSVDYANEFHKVNYDDQVPINVSQQSGLSGHINPRDASTKMMNGIDDYVPPSFANNSPLICSSGPDAYGNHPHPSLPIQPLHLPTQLNVGDPFYDGSTKDRPIISHMRANLPLKTGLSALDLARVPSEVAKVPTNSNGINGNNSILSPVFETRTPSPATARKNEAASMTNGYRKPTSVVSPAANSTSTATNSIVEESFRSSKSSIATSNAKSLSSPLRMNGVDLSHYERDPNLPRKENFMLPAKAKPTNTSVMAKSYDFGIPVQYSNAGGSGAGNGNSNNGAVHAVNIMGINNTTYANNVHSGISSSNGNAWQRSGKKGDRRRSKSNVMVGAHGGGIPDSRGGKAIVLQLGEGHVKGG